MLDLTLRSTKESLLTPVCHLIPSSVSPTHLTLAGFFFGLACCFSAIFSSSSIATHDVTLTLCLWTVNRLLDSLDGSLARSRESAMETGGFLDLLCDFIIYSLIPPAVACGEDRYRSTVVGLSAIDWRSVAFLEATFHINNFVLFYVAAVAAKVQSQGGKQKSTDLTSLIMKPALVEGFESAIAFTLMLTFPNHIESLTWGMGCAVLIGIVQRLFYIIPVLKQVDRIDK